MRKINLTYTNTFVVVLFILFLAFVIGLLNNPFGAQRQIFFSGMEDFFADFFNILRYIADRDPYFNPVNGYGEKAYFPLSYLILYPFSQLDNFNAMSLQETWNSKIGLMSVFLFTMFSVFLLFFSLNQLRKKYDVTTSPAVFIGLVLSYTFFITIERGNTIMLATAFVIFFICYYNSECKNERVLAIISLALAVTLKVYPVIFGFLYFEKKQYREIFLSVVVTLFLVFIPYLFFKRGFANFPQQINNVMLNSDNYNYTRMYPRFSLAHLVFYGTSIFKFSEKVIFSLSGIAQIINILVSVISIILSCLINNKWLKISLLTMAVVFLPTNSGWYCGLYIFPMIVLFFATLKERAKLFNTFILVVFIIFLNPFQIAIKYKDILFSINYVLGNIALLSLWLVLLIISGKQIVLKYFKRRQV